MTDKEMIERAYTLFKAVMDLIRQQEESPYVLDILSQSIYYDDAECDTWCLMDDISIWFSDYESWKGDQS